MTAHPDPLVHWRYFLTLDDDLLRASRYVEICEDNLTCHSIELSRVVIMASVESEVVAKQLALRIDAASNPKNMGDCRAILAGHFKSLPTVEIHALNGLITLQPWKAWVDGTRPDWWEAYTNLKHSRHIHFREANLRHALEAVAGLMVLSVFLYEQAAFDGQLNPSPQLFSFGRPITTDRSFYNQSNLIYKIQHAV